VIDLRNWQGGFVLPKLPAILAEMVAGGVSPATLFHDAVETLTIGVVVLDLQGRIQYANKAYCNMSGFSAEALGNRSFVSMEHPEDQAASQAQLARLMGGEEERVQMEGRQVGKDGSPLWVHIGASLLRDGSRKPHAVMVVVEDIDDRKAAENLLQRTEKLAAAGRLAATVAHEINNPLEAVGNLVYLALHEQGLPPTSIRYLAMANEELRRVGHIVSQTLGFYRDSGVSQSLDLSALADDVLSLYQRKLDARQIRVTRSMERVTVEGVAGELRQVVANLLSNALDAMEPYGVLAMEVRTHRDEVRLSISDTGHGIATPLLDRIFEPFFTTKKDVGTGLGLWVSKGIVEKHHGRLEVISSQKDEDHGTAFVMTLPRRDALLRSA
jgi:PAS domain S-box-containing protein